MISIEDRKQFARAEAKARQVRPHVSMIEFGTYSVASSQPDKAPYTVKFLKTATGHWAASCTCKAHTGDGRPGYMPKACFHLVSAYSAHRIQVNIRKQVRASQEAQEPETGPFCGCGADAAVWTGQEWLCWPCLHKLAQAEAEKQADMVAQAEALYQDLLEPIYRADAEYKAAQLPPVEVARALADQALAALAGSVQEIEDFIAESNASMDRECPKCGLVQPDDDSSDCWCCGAILNPDDVDPDYTAAQAERDRADLFG